MSYGYAEVSQATADALTRLSVVGDVDTLIDVERAAWLLYVLKEVPDSPDVFPRGKWATIQHIEAQVQAQAAQRAKEAL